MNELQIVFITIWASFTLCYICKIVIDIRWMLKKILDKQDNL